jgi:hypothetical protein
MDSACSDNSYCVFNSKTNSCGCEIVKAKNGKDDNSVMQKAKSGSGSSKGCGVSGGSCTGSCVCSDGYYKPDCKPDKVVIEQGKYAIKSCYCPCDNSITLPGGGIDAGAIRQNQTNQVKTPSDIKVNK